MERGLSSFRDGMATQSRRERVDQAMVQLARHPLIEHYKPHILGEGQASSVFVVERPGKESRSVIKVRRGYLEQMLEAGIHPFEDETPEESRGYYLPALEQVQKREQESIRAFENYFSPFVLKERVTIMDVPMTDKLLGALTPPEHERLRLPKGVHEAPTLVYVQEKAPMEAFAGDSRSLQTPFLEDHPMILDRSHLDAYEAINSFFVDGDTDPNLQYGLSFLGYNDDTKILSKEIHEDLELKEVLKTFVSSSIRYSNETGEILDFVGDNNIRIFKERKKEAVAWKVLLIDARISGALFENGKKAIEQMLKGDELSIKEIKTAELALNYVRFLNALAAELGMHERLAISDQPLFGHGEELMQYFEMIAPKKESSEQNEAMAAK